MHERRERIGLVDDLRELGAPEEEIDCAGDALAVHKVGDLGDLVRILDAHALLHRPPKLQEALAQLLHRQLVERAQATVAQVVDVVHLRRGLPRLGVDPLGTQIQDVRDDLQEVLGPDEHLLFRNVQPELAVDPETPHPTQAIPGVVVELLQEQLLGLVDLRRVARTQLRVDLQQSSLIVVLGLELLELLLGDRVQDQRVARVLDDPNLLQRAVQDLRRGFLADLPTHVHELLARLGVDDARSRPVLGTDLLGLDLGDLVEQPEQRVGRRDGLVQAAQERGRRDLRALVDPHRQNVLLGHLELDPRAALGNDAGRVQRTIAFGRHDREVHARGAVELAHDHALGAVHDELAPAHHDRELPEVDLLLGHLRVVLARELHADPEREPVGEAQLPTLVGGVPGFLERVVQILKLHRAVVRLDGIDLAEQRFEPDRRIPVVRALLDLQESLVSIVLNPRQNGDGGAVATLGKIAHGCRCHHDPRDGWDSRPAFETGRFGCLAMPSTSNRPEPARCPLCCRSQRNRQVYPATSGRASRPARIPDARPAACFTISPHTCESKDKGLPQCGETLVQNHREWST